MKHVARIALVVALLLFNNIGISYSALPVPKTETLQWEVLYREAIEHLNPKNKYELEWEGLNQKITNSIVRNDAPEQVIALTEQAYDYALKHLGFSHPFTNVSYKRLLYDISLKYGNERAIPLYMRKGGNLLTMKNVRRSLLLLNMPMVMQNNI
jgi:hypothetical protein